MAESSEITVVLLGSSRIKMTQNRLPLALYAVVSIAGVYHNGVTRIPYPSGRLIKSRLQVQNGWRGCGRFGFWIIPIQLLAVLLSISSGAIADETNLLANGSFEQVGDSPDQAASWSRWGDWINREDSWTPTHEGKAIVGYHHWQIEKPDDSGMWQDVKVQAGKKYKFTLYVQRDDPATAHGADNIQIALESTEVEPPKAIKITTTPVADLPVGINWSQLSVEGVATSDAIRVLIRVVPSKDGPRGGAVKFDDASLTIAKS